MNVVSVTWPMVVPSTLAVIVLPEKPSPIVCHVFSPSPARVPEASVVRVPLLVLRAIDQAPVSLIRNW